MISNFLFSLNLKAEILFVVKICRECFYEVFEAEIHQVIVENRLFKAGERIGIGASGGKGEHLCLIWNWNWHRNMLVNPFEIDVQIPLSLRTCYQN